MEDSSAPPLVGKCESSLPIRLVDKLVCTEWRTARAHMLYRATTLYAQFSMPYKQLIDRLITAFALIHQRKST